MQEWSRDPITSGLVRNTPLSHTPPPEIYPIMANHVSLQDKFCSIRTSLPSYIILPEANGNNFELKPQFINTLHGFHGLESENAYFFIRKFEEVWLMMRIPQLGKDVVRLDLYPLHLKTWPTNGYTTCLLVLFHNGMTLLRYFLRNSTPSIRLPSSGITLCSINKKPMNRPENISKGLRIC